MFKITIEGQDFESFEANVAKAAETICGAHKITGDVHTVLTEDQMADAKKEQAPEKKTTKKKAEPKKEAVEEKVETAVEEPEVDESPAELSYDKDIKPNVLKYAQAKGRNALVALLDSFGVPSAQNLQPQQFGAFIDAIQKELGDE